MRRFYCLHFCRVCWVCCRLAWQPRVDGDGLISHKQRDSSNPPQYPRCPGNPEERFYRLWGHCCVDKGLSRDIWLDAGPGAGGGWRGTVEGQGINTGLAQGWESSGALLERTERLLCCQELLISARVGLTAQVGSLLLLHLPFPTFMGRLGLSQAGIRAGNSLPCSQIHRCVTVP